MRRSTCGPSEALELGQNQTCQNSFFTALNPLFLPLQSDWGQPRIQPSVDPKKLINGQKIYLVNERFFEMTRKEVADIDLASCYGSALTSFHYPIGLPTVYSRTPNDEYMSLGEFLKKYGDFKRFGKIYLIYDQISLSLPQLIHNFV